MPEPRSAAFRPRPSSSIAFAFALCSATPGQELVPAGVIDDVVARHDALFVVQDDPAVARFAEAIRLRFFAKCGTMSDAEAVESQPRGKDLVVYGTPASAWISAQAKRLPFRFVEGAVEIAGRRFEGAHLRVICAVKNPHDPARTALIYAARDAADVVGINSVHHGSTSWVVADGDRVLASGEFVSKAPLGIDEQRQDLEFLRKTVAEVHPATAKGLPEAVAKALAEAEAAATEPRPRERHWRSLQAVLLALHDAHSTLAPPTSGERIDLPMAWLEEGLVVSEDRGALRAGDLLLSLGGRDAKALLSALSETLPAENPYWLRARGETLLSDVGMLRALGIAEGAPVRVRVERDGKVLEVDVPLAGAGAGSRPQRPWARFEIDKAHDLAVFTLDRCDVDAAYRARLAELFQAVHEQGIGRIAVDLRANSGGNSAVLDEFLRYVDVESYASFAGEVRASSAAREQRGLLAGLGMLGGSVRRKNARHDDPPPFPGELLVLAGGHTFSSGNWFAVVVQDNHIGKVVGEPTGNAPSSFGDVLSFQLPASRISFTLSYKRWLRPDPKRDPAETLVPDVPVPRTRQHVRDHVDPVLERLRGGR